MASCQDYISLRDQNGVYIITCFPPVHFTSLRTLWASLASVSSEQFLSILSGATSWKLGMKHLSSDHFSMLLMKFSQQATNMVWGFGVVSYSWQGTVSVWSLIICFLVKYMVAMDTSAELLTVSLIFNDEVGKWENWIQNSSSREWTIMVKSKSFFIWRLIPSILDSNDLIQKPVNTGLDWISDRKMPLHIFQS